ncbi:MAG: aldehyde dehydrogenase family protein [Actinomycetota bacterium]
MTTTTAFGQAPAETDELHATFDEGMATIRAQLGHQHPFVVAGTPRDGARSRQQWSPIDRDLVIGDFAQATGTDVDDAVEASAAYAATWGSSDWRERVAIVRRAADIMEARRGELAAMSVLETAKNRMEAFGEVDETVGLLRLNAHQVEENEGFSYRLPGDGGGSYLDVLRPYGVWGLISPFNFPLALAANPVSAALLAGNCLVFKPAHQGVWTGLMIYEIFREAGIPAEAFHVVPGPGAVVGARIASHPGIDGITFTGSYDVGMGIYRQRDGAPRPAICELGGKNPSVVTGEADLAKAAEGVMHGAFGFGGQKCASNSRSYIQRSVYDEFVERLRSMAEDIVIGDPADKGVYLGPLINDAAGERYVNAVAEARSAGTVVTGGEKLDGGVFDRGNYVRPTVVEVPEDSWLWERELFTPFIAVEPYDDLGDAIAKANDTEFGLTAGFFSEDAGEIDRFLDHIEAGVVYVNRRASSTTGAWPGLQTFGGWKGSGTSGRSVGGRFYVAQYMREQSRTVIAS